MRVAIINDTHSGVKNGSDIFLDYSAKFYDEVFFPYLLKNDIKDIIHLGDYFDHRRFVNFKVLKHNYEVFIKKLYDYDMYMDIIPGNHDVYYKNTNNLNSLEQILAKYDDRIRIQMEPTVKNIGGLDIGLLPWICEDNQESSMEFVKNSKASILMGHLELGGFKYMGNANIKSHGLDKSLFDRYDAVYSGHYHTKSSEGNVTYLGTQYQLTWSDANDPKYFHILDTETRELEAIRNPNVLFQKIYYDEDAIPEISSDLIKETYIKVIVTKKKDLFVFDKFMEQIYDFNPYEVRIIENFDEYAGDKINDQDVKVDDTPTLLNTYIDATETNLDADVLKKMMQELLVEAQALDTI
jgi:hypothetical protein